MARTISDLFSKKTDIPFYISYIHKITPNQTLKQNNQSTLNPRRHRERDHREMRDLKDLQKSLNQTQRVRLQSALQQLQEIYSRASSSPAAAVSVSDCIHVNLEDGVLK